MATAVKFSGQIQMQRQTICFKEMSRLSLGPSFLKKSSHFMQNNVKIEQQGVRLKRQPERVMVNNRRLNLVKSTAEDADFTVHLLSAANMIKQFYTCVNDKKLKELGNYIADDCYFEDCSFIYPIQGKKEVMQFFQKLTTGMGQNVKFCIEHVCEDDEFTAGVDWHLEWNKMQIPFTRGCSFYECSQKDNSLIIQNARVVIESPIKPGGIGLTLLKNVTALFDNFPKAAEWFLKYPQATLVFLSKVYKRFLAPIVKPLVAGYIRMWGLIVQAYAFPLKCLIFILKKFFG